MGYFINLRHNAAIKGRIAVMRPLARELVVDDPSQAAAVKLPELWFDENRWDVHLPPGAYRLCLATREVGKDGLAPVASSAPLRAGRHEIELEQVRVPGGWSVVVTWDGSGRLARDEPAEWDPNAGSEGGGLFSTSAQAPADRALVLFRRSFYEMGSGYRTIPPSGPTEGILLWIEHVPASAPGPATSKP